MRKRQSAEIDGIWRKQNFCLKTLRNSILAKYWIKYYGFRPPPYNMLSKLHKTCGGVETEDRGSSLGLTEAKLRIKDFGFRPPTHPYNM